MMPPRASELVHGKRPLIVAHRGDSRLAPENTLPAFLSASEAGSDFIELDYRHTADGIPVVIHDDTLNRVTNARAVWPNDPEEIKLSSKTLAEVLETISPRTCIAIERKDGDPETLLKVLSPEQRQRVVVMAFDWKYLAALHDLDEDIELVALGKGELTDERFSGIEQTGATIVNWDYRNLAVDDIRRIHDRGLKTWTWTVDDPQRATLLLNGGLDGLTTNHPRKMLALRAELGK